MKEKSLPKRLKSLPKRLETRLRVISLLESLVYNTIEFGSPSNKVINDTCAL